MKSWIEQIPESGYLIALFPDAIVLEPYEVKNGKLVSASAARIQNEMPAELHVFDRKTFCHIVRRNADGDLIVSVFTEDEEKDMDPDLLYVQEQLIKPEYRTDPNMPEKLKVIHRYTYSQYDTLVLRNFRITW